MRFKKVLCAIDFSDNTRAVVDAALRFANASDAVITLAHVATPLGLPFLAEAQTDTPEEMKAQHQEVERALTVWRNEARGLGGTRTIETVVLEGTPWRELVGWASQHAQDLIVTGSRGDSGPSHSMLGSTAERVVRHAPCAVLIATVPREAPSPGEHAVRALSPIIKKILCPVDFSVHSRQALILASEVALNSHAALTILYAFDLPLAGGGKIFPPSAAAIAEYLARIHSTLTEWADLPRKLGIEKVEIASIQAVPWKEIVERADDEEFDLVVLGSSGHGALKHAFFGSTVERVVRHAPCAVLTSYLTVEMGG